MKKHVIIINGAEGVGKRTFMDLAGLMEPSCYTSFNDAFTDDSKLLSLGEASTMTVNELLMNVLDYLTKPRSEYAFSYLTAFVNVFKASPNIDLLFLSIDNPVDIERAKHMFNATTLLIANPRVPVTMENSYVYIYDYDMIIDNSGSIEDLKWDVCRFLLLLVARDNLKGEALFNAEQIITRGLD